MTFKNIHVGFDSSCLSLEERHTRKSENCWRLSPPLSASLADRFVSDQFIIVITILLLIVLRIRRVRHTAVRIRLA